MGEYLLRRDHLANLKNKDRAEQENILLPSLEGTTSIAFDEKLANSGTTGLGCNFAHQIAPECDRGQGRRRNVL